MMVSRIIIKYIFVDRYIRRNFNQKQIKRFYFIIFLQDLKKKIRVQNDKRNDFMQKMT